MMRRNSFLYSIAAAVLAIIYLFLPVNASATGRYEPLYFDLTEFDSPDAPGTGRFMKDKFLKLLDQIRKEVGVMTVNSGYRTKSYNEELKRRGFPAASNSAHMKGLAADIHCSDADFMEALIRSAKRKGIRRIGQYITPNGNMFVHLDIDNSKTYQGEWAYRDGEKSSLFVIT